MYKPDIKGIADKVKERGKKTLETITGKYHEKAPVYADKTKKKAADGLEKLDKKYSVIDKLKNMSAGYNHMIELYDAFKDKKFETVEDIKKECEPYVPFQKEIGKWGARGAYFFFPRHPIKGFKYAKKILVPSIGEHLADRKAKKAEKKAKKKMGPDCDGTCKCPSKSDIDYIMRINGKK